MTDEAARLEEEWKHLKARNDQKLQLLAVQGLAVDVGAIVTQMWIEHILMTLVGDEGVLACRVATQERIAAIVDEAESQLRRRKIVVPTNGHPVTP